MPSAPSSTLPAEAEDELRAGAKKLQVTIPSDIPEYPSVPGSRSPPRYVTGPPVPQSRLDVFERLRADLDAEKIQVPGPLPVPGLQALKPESLVQTGFLARDLGSTTHQRVQHWLCPSSLNHPGQVNKPRLSPLAGIIVCGNQSAGKSSVLESISGIDFPRGDNMCTRCPCVVSLEVDRACKEPRVVLATDARYEKNRVECKLPEVAQHIIALTNIICDDGTSPPPRSPPQPGWTLAWSLASFFGVASVLLTARSHTVSSLCDLLLKHCLLMEHRFLNVQRRLGGSAFAPQLRNRGGPNPGVVTKIDSVAPDSDIVEKIKMSRRSDVKLKQVVS
ncbi:hypothetical protein T484DRAFT_1744570 [Baffinella frigidus]|nr:hypothetical protein T484DRAFT_1744570 [Cryptophyta sp. CCMP2293]